MTLVLPSLVQIEKIGKNTIQQYLLPENTIETNDIIFRNNHFTIGGEYCIVKKGSGRPDDIEKVLTSKIKPYQGTTIESDLEISWLKHPMLNGVFDAVATLNSWAGAFSFIEEKADRKGLRKPQIAAIFSSLSHWKLSEEIGTVVLPTGVGKTETMISLLVAAQCPKLLVIVPTDALREQIANKFLTFGYLKNNEFGIVSQDAQYPIVGTLKEGIHIDTDLTDFINKCNVVITTMDLIASANEEVQKVYAEAFSHCFVDEAHHVKADTWNTFIGKCKTVKILQFTATPYRNDGKDLGGKFVVNYSLKQAQQDGYFKNVKFEPVIEWDESLSDEKIAEKAVGILREDLKQYNHILMARCATQSRANKVFEIYAKHGDLNPVVIHTGLSLSARAEAKEKILSKRAKIIVCVDMFGEGFDLPNLKIAAFHDIKKSLPITLQLAGRFTRTRHDEELGDATIVANVAQADVKSELADFYALGADWNSILPRVSEMEVNREVEFAEFLGGFENLDNSRIPFNTLYPALSTVVYKNPTDTWFPSNFKAGLPNVDSYDYIYHDINRQKQILVVITGKKSGIVWGDSKDIYNIVWDLIIVYWETRNNLLFIHASDKSGVYKELAQAIVENAQLVHRIDVFKSFHNINRIRLQNIGLKQFLGKNRSFIMSTGYDIEKALSDAEKTKGEKAFVFGIGYENGDKVSLGCSYKGRIWSHDSGNLKEFVEWCDSIGKKIVNPDIDPNTVLKDTLLPVLTVIRPQILPFAIDWNDQIYHELETRFTFKINGKPYKFYRVELQLRDATETGELLFDIVTDDGGVTFKQTIREVEVPGTDEKYPDYKISVVTPNVEIVVEYGRAEASIEQFFENFPPTFWFVNGSSLSGCEFVDFKTMLTKFNPDQIIGREWEGVNIQHESQHLNPKIVDSIQYNMIDELKQGEFDIIYDDDYSGEIADIITVKKVNDKIMVQLYHLKYAIGGITSTRVDNLYELCGQAQKSINWKYREAHELFEHMLRRETKRRGDAECSRLEVGSIEDLQRFRHLSKDYPVEFEIFIVQPGISKANISESQAILLAVVDNYIKEKTQISLTVIGSR